MKLPWSKKARTPEAAAPEEVEAVDEAPAAPAEEGAAPVEAVEAVEAADTPESKAEGIPPGRRNRVPGLFRSLRSTRSALSHVSRREVVVASLGMGIIGAAALVVFSGASFWWTSQPSFCARCHVMRPYIDAWKQSPHKSVNCEDCHLTPGFFGYVGGKISGLQVVMNYIRGNYTDSSFNAAVGNASCLQCHQNILDGNIHSGGITVSHSNIIDAGGKCMYCHSTVAHGNAVPFGSQTHPTMQTCLTCHNNQIAPLQCDLCHTGRLPPSASPAVVPTGQPVGTG